MTETVAPIEAARERALAVALELTQPDLDRLRSYLRGRLPGFDRALHARPLTGGQSNPTFLLSAGDDRYVLRRKPPGQLLASAHAIDREYRVMKALASSEVPVPQVIHYCDDAEVLDTPFYLMEFVEGRVLRDPTLAGLAPDERAAIYDELNRVIAALHRTDWRAQLSDFGKPANYLGRQIERWTRQYRASQTEPIEAMERLIEWLPANLPDDDETALVHGDYRIDNLVFHPDEPRVVAVLDWELSTLGHPLADFAYHCMAWRVTADEFRGIRGNDLESLGIPLEKPYVDDYCRRTGRRAIAHWDYYMAFNMFRMAAILQGIAARARAGNAASAEAGEVGRRARPMAEAGWREASRVGRR